MRGATVSGAGHVRGARVGSAAGAKAEADATRPARARTRAYMVLRDEGTIVARILAFSDSVGRIASEENVTGNTRHRNKNATIMLCEVVYGDLHTISCTSCFQHIFCTNFMKMTPFSRDTTRNFPCATLSILMKLFVQQDFQLSNIIIWVCTN